MIVAVEVGPAATAHAAAVFRTVAYSGMQSPGAAAGTRFDGLGYPVLNKSGFTAFSARLTAAGASITATNDSGIWSEGPGTLTLVAREGNQAPGAPPGATFDDLTDVIPLLNSSGRVAFGARLQSTGGGVTATNDSGIWSEGAGLLTLVAREGSQAPDLPAGANFGAFTNLAFNALGRVAFRAALQSTGGGVTATNDSGIWSERPGALTLVAREGSQAAGAPVGANFGGFGAPVLDSSGRTAFVATLQTTGGGVTSANNAGVWSQGPGALSLIARKGSQAPGMPVGGNFELFDKLVINDTGYVAFNGYARTSPTTIISGLWSEGTGTLSLVAREGIQAPGTPVGATFGTLFSPVINANGRTAFEALLSTTGGGVSDNNDSGIWSEGTGALSLVAREGSPAPGAGGATFARFNSLAINNSGRTAFHATIHDAGFELPNADGLWIENPSGEVSLVARSGDLYEIIPGEFRTFDGFAILSSSAEGQDGLGAGFGDDFSVAFVARFTDGSWGVLTARLVIPEPISQFQVVIAVACIIPQCRKKKPNKWRVS